MAQTDIFNALSEATREVRQLKEQNDELRKALKTIASVPLPKEVGALKLDEHDAAGFIRIARRALGM